MLDIGYDGDDVNKKALFPPRDEDEEDEEEEEGSVNDDDGEEEEGDEDLGGGDNDAGGNKPDEEKADDKDMGEQMDFSTQEKTLDDYNEWWRKQQVRAREATSLLPTPLPSLTP